MKLKTFNSTNVQHLRSGKPYLHCNSKTGLITINTQAAEIIGIKTDDMIQFHQSEDEPSEWYVEAVKKDGFLVRQKDDYGFLTNSTRIVQMIFASVEYIGTGGRLYIGEQVKFGKQNLITLITAGLINE